MAESDVAAPKGTLDGRIVWMDSLKGVLILLVVIGHVLLPIHSEGPYVSGTYDLIYLFHMPLFIFVSGFFAKHAVDGEGRLRVDRVLTYAALGLAFNVTLRLYAGQSLTLLRALDLPSAPWYLVSLAAWYLLVPFFSRLRPVCGLVLAALVSIAATVIRDQTDVLALSRTAHFLPYFFAGYYLGSPSLERLRTPMVRRALVCVGVAAALCYLAFQDELAGIYPFVYGNSVCRMRLLVAIPGYLLISALGIMLALCCMALAPAGARGAGRLISRPLSFLGRRTLQIYICHRFVRETMSQMGFYEWAVGLEQPVLLALLVTIALVICLVFSWGGFTRALSRLTSLRWTFMLRS